MLTVSSNGQIIWSTGQATGQMTFLAQPLLTGSDEAVVSFRDYNQDGQIAWIEVKGKVFFYHLETLIFQTNSLTKCS